MNEYKHNGLGWSHLLLLVFVFVLGIFVPLSWHRQHGRNPIEPLGNRNPNKETVPAEHTDPTFVASRNNSDQSASVAPPSAAVEGIAFKKLSVAQSSDHPDRVDAGNTKLKATNAFRRDISQHDPAPLYRSTAWPRCAAIEARLEMLQQDEQTAAWSARAMDLFEELVATENLEENGVSEILDRLDTAAKDADRIARLIETGPVFYQLNAIAYDISRRIDVWRAAHLLASEAPQLVSVQGNPFLEISYLGKPVGNSTGFRSIDVSGLLTAIEQYEFSRLGSDAAKIAKVIEPLIASGNPAQQRLGEALDLHYRNANLRITASSEFINRILPTARTESSRINDQIMGLPVWGDSRIKTSLYTRLIPDPHRIRIGMEAWGHVFSDTVASSGSVYLYNEGVTAFLVRKLILIDSEGVKAKPTIAEALSESDLVDIETDYDGIPFVGSIVRNSARRQYANNHASALLQTEQRVANSARRKFDQELNPRLRKAIDGFYHDLWLPLDRLELEPTAIRLSTTEERATGRLRIGNAEQLTAYSARPRALAGSMLSMQMHESAMNNAISQFDLDGKTFSLHDLYLQIMEKLNRKVDEVPASMPKNVVISFANRDAVRVRCDDDVVTLTLGLDKVSKGTKYKWSHLLVRARYAIESDGIQARLTRCSSIELEGKRLRTRDQIALRGVFSKLLSRSKQLELVPEKLTKNPRMSNLAVTQQIIDDGWIGLAIGPTFETGSLSQHSRPHDWTTR